MNIRQQNVDRDVVNGPKRDTSLHLNAFVKQTVPSFIQRCKIIPQTRCLHIMEISQGFSFTADYHSFGKGYHYQSFQSLTEETFCRCQNIEM